jgi:hypothetical protein
MATTIGPLLQSLLDRYGLGSLADWAAELLITGASEDEIILQLYDRPEVAARFPWLKQREAAGLTPLSIEEGLQYENFARQTAKSLGLNITDEEIWANIGGDVSIKELEDRISMASAAVHSLNPMVRAQTEMLYGITTEDFIRSWLNPKEQAPVLRKRLVASQIAAGSLLSGFGQLTAPQAERLYEGGFDPEQAQQAFTRLAQQRELFEATEGTEEDIGMNEQIGSLLGDTNTLTELQRRAQRRTGYFQSGGQFATGRGGVGGLGSAATP